MASKSKERGRRSGRGVGLRRIIAAAALMPLAGRAPLYARLLASLIGDSRVPASRKALLAGALGYLVLGRDLIPDSIPVLGQIDDLVVIALATEVFLEGIDEEILAEKLEEAGISRAAYDEDIARVRRLMPAPLRRAVGRIPGAIRIAADAATKSGIQPNLRRWITREGSPA